MQKDQRCRHQAQHNSETPQERHHQQVGQQSDLRDYVKIGRNERERADRCTQSNKTVETGPAPKPLPPLRRVVISRFVPIILPDSETMQTKKNSQDGHKGKLKRNIKDRSRPDQRYDQGGKGEAAKDLLFSVKQPRGETATIITARKVETLPPARPAYSSTTGSVKNAASLGTDHINSAY